MNNNNAICSICGQPYYMCLSCKDLAKAKPWQIYTDTSEHYKIYQILHGYNFGVYTKEEAKEKLLKTDLSGLKGFNDTVKQMIEEILDSNVKKAETKVEVKAEIAKDNKVDVDVENVDKVEKVVTEKDTEEVKVKPEVSKLFQPYRKDKYKK